MIGNVDEMQKTRPEHAYFEEYEVQEGDIIISGTDGFFDNMWSSEIIEALNYASKKFEK